MEYTFDQYRPLTTIDHFIMDFYDYKKDRDREHIIDQFEHLATFNNEHGYEGECINIPSVIKKHTKGERIDIHYHTFTENNFKEILDFFEKDIAKWSQIDVIKRIPYEGSNEFYVELIK